MGGGAKVLGELRGVGKTKNLLAEAKTGSFANVAIPNVLYYLQKRDMN